MTYTYDLSTDVGKVRLTIPDRVEADATWSDEEIQTFLDVENDNWRRATALALETMASDDLIVLKVMKVQNIEVDAAKVMESMLKRAKSLRELAKEAEADETDGFEIAEMVTNDWQYRERIYNQALRGNV